MKIPTIALILPLTALGACNGAPAPKPSASATAAAAPASNTIANPDDDPIEPVAENEAEHGHPHDGEDADHTH